MGNIEQSKINDAIEALGSLVSSAGGEGDEALDTVKDMSEELRSVREQLRGGVEALERIRDWELDPGDEPEYVWDELRKIAVEVVGPRLSPNRGQ